MKSFLNKIKQSMGGQSDILDHNDSEEYVELGADGNGDASNVLVRPFVLDSFEGIKPILDSLREAQTIALINIKPLKDKDLVELKRAINKLKKTCDALEGDIAGFGDSWIAATPSFARIYRENKPAQPQAAAVTPAVTEYSAE